VPDETYCVIGAGSSGLAALKNLRAHGLPAVCLEQAPDLGGNWHFGQGTSRVYRSVRMISSKPFTQYADLPMPDTGSPYPHHSEVLDYFRRYADHFGLREHIRFGTAVEKVEAVSGGRRWAVTTGEGTREYAGVVVANGHNWVPKVPGYPGEFTGEVLHSADYKDSSVLAGKRVLVVGAGNTGCDIVVEAAQVAAQALHSTRRGYWYAPKFVLGRPGDQVMDLSHALRAPLWLRRAIFRIVLRSTTGKMTDYGLPEPDHKPFETHPIVNSLLLYYLGHGAITPKPDVARFDGGDVVFTDGSRATVDLVLYATGYRATFDFLPDLAALNWADDRPRLYQHVFTPRHDNLFVAGLIQPDSGQFTLAHWQAVAIASFLRARRDRPAVAEAFLRDAAAHLDEAYSAGTRYKNSTRHYFEVAHVDYLRGLERTINRLRAA
jgi:cation diffusion facilitator CzcD-associated flavoprotein CzcO